MNTFGKTNIGLRSLLFVTSALCALFAVSQPVLAAPDPYLTGSGSVTSYSGSAVSITNLQVAGTGNPTTPVKLRVSSGTLAMGTTTGLTFTGSSTGSTLQFSGTLANVNAALATLTYTRTGTGTDTLEASLVNAGEVFFADTGHLYEYVSYSANWSSANTNAQTRTKYGATGYLTTITSQAENDFVAARLLNAGWMGASDAASEGDWKWVTGPESGTSFWSGASGGSTVSGRYANWGTGEPNDAGGEDCAQFLTGGSGKWNDLPCTTYALPGYVVEYGSPSSPIEISSLNLSITTLAANNTPSAPSSLGPTAYVTGAWGTDDAPAFSFTLSDADAANTVQYRIQIDNTADFSSPVVDYTAALATQGARTFTVGQAAGSGSYAIGSAGQALADGVYYWRVRATDNIGASSSYATANGGGVAFRVDTTAPSIPSALSVTSILNDTTPSLTWLASSDEGVGLHSTAPYTVQWSDDAAFGVVTTLSSTTNSFTVPDGQALADGTRYLRVRAKDALNTASAYTSQTVSVVIDTTAPSVPGMPAASSSSSDNTPTWSWSASTDTGVGLDNQPYWVEWSQTSDFSGVVQTNTAAASTYTHSLALADGTWYFRVKAIDARANESSYSPTASIIIDTKVPVVAKVSSSTRSQASSSNTEPTLTITETPTTNTAFVPLVRVLVVDANGNPVQGAKVTLHSTPRVAYSDGAGYAVFRDVEAGAHHVVVEYAGITKKQALAITPDDHDVLANVTLAKAHKASATKSSEKSTSLFTVLIVFVLLLAMLWLVVVLRRRRKPASA